MRNPVVIEKRKQRSLEKYGVEYPTQTKSQQLKMVATKRRNGDYIKASETFKRWHKTPESREHIRKLVDMHIDYEFLKKYGVMRSQFPYHSVFSRAMKRVILAIWENRCVVTGMTNEEHKLLYHQPLHIHHWNYDKMTDDPYWLIPVCMPINEMANYDKEAWMALFGGIVEERIPMWKYQVD
jgi:hypothetical protein